MFDCYLIGKLKQINLYQIRPFGQILLKLHCSFVRQNTFLFGPFSVMWPKFRPVWITHGFPGHGVVRARRPSFCYGPFGQSAKLSLQSSELGLPQPLASWRVCPPPRWFRGEGHIRWRERGWESPNSDEGTYTVVLYRVLQCIHIYVHTLWVWS
jgi:hypothetical protein